ncbi:hypothetical protein N5D77_20795 [Comamonas thiooxydans]|uniref:Uncharacterized protein n=1 Tax=Comamonas thiooxydans TaxID=363952 RepID=A0AA42Q2M4_9BURK|nr:hypothetical protein [Comamonas thiooxydans]MDH1336127.1 hypothetical protein [Comamonas thiooxydans]MDH1741992.1 hypothetical protein [Comamonas thiooxydans]MDH1789019.1 hypothetical protein [Comamonas thiooxydans]
MFQFLNLGQEPDADHDQSALPATIRKSRRPKDGLKSLGLAWLGFRWSHWIESEEKQFVFNDLQCSTDVSGNPWKAGVERVMGITYDSQPFD